MKRFLAVLASLMALVVVSGFTTQDALAERASAESYQVEPDPVVTYVADKAHTQVMFKVRHLGISRVTGRFGDFDATIKLDADDLSTLEVNATVGVASVDTGVERRDDHLRSGDFFEAEAYPSMRFESTGVSDIDGTTFKLHGTLTIKDVTKPVVFDAELLGTGEGMGGKKIAALVAETTINRFDYNLKWDRLTEAGGLVVGEDVTIQLEVEAVAQ